jgi:hypothetical protein
VLTGFAVVVPAHDEQELLPNCLAALRAATAGAGVPVEVIVVADDCADDTARLAAAAGAEVVTVAAGNVGRARAAGMAYALRHGSAGLWLATTDADSRVPPGWLGWHARHVARGAEVLVGTVAVDDWTPWPDPVRYAYERRYRAAPRHVHGANLGCSGEAYAALGGFAAVPHDEDRDLVTRATRAGLRVVFDARSPVLTSARRTARAPAGFAAHLAAVAGEVSAGRDGDRAAPGPPGVADHRRRPHGHDREDERGRPAVAAPVQEQGAEIHQGDEGTEHRWTHVRTPYEQYRRGSAGGRTGGSPRGGGVAR